MKKKSVRGGSTAGLDFSGGRACTERLREMFLGYCVAVFCTYKSSLYISLSCV